MLDTVKKVRTNASAMLCVSNANTTGIQNTQMVLIAYTGLTSPTTENRFPSVFSIDLTTYLHWRESRSVTCSFTSLEADSPPPATLPLHNRPGATV